MPVQMPVCDGDLLRRHVHADYRTCRPGKLRQHIGIAARAAAEVQNARTLQQRRRNQPATVVFGLHFIVHVTQQTAQPGRYILRRATGAR